MIFTNSQAKTSSQYHSWSRWRCSYSHSQSSLISHWVRQQQMRPGRQHFLMHTVRHASSHWDHLWTLSCIIYGHPA